MKTSAIHSLTIINIVACARVADSIDLESMSAGFTNCTFSKRKFPGAVWSIENPKSTALIFSTGKVVLTGHHRTRDVAVSLHVLLQEFQKVGISCYHDPQPTITNIVCTYDLGFPVNLIRIVTALMDSEMVEYEPEAFPGLVCRISDPRLVFLLFSSGKLVIAGGKTLDEVTAGLAVFLEKLSIVDDRISGTDPILECGQEQSLAGTVSVTSRKKRQAAGLQGR